MRPYRGKTEEGKWVYGWYCEIAETHFIIPKSAIRWVYKGIISSADRLEFTGFIKVIPKSVGQSTGRLDKNKKEEYAGDIIKQNGILGVWEVIYESPAFKGKCISDVKPAVQIAGRLYKKSLLGDISRLYSQGFEIIGNKAQNPKLIEGKDNE